MRIARRAAGSASRLADKLGRPLLNSDRRLMRLDTKLEHPGGLRLNPSQAVDRGGTPEAGDTLAAAAALRSSGSAVLTSTAASPRPGSSLYPTSPLGEKDPRIPTGRDVEWEPLVDYRRERRERDDDPRRGRLGVRRQGRPLLRRQRALLRPQHDEAVDDQGLHRRARPGTDWRQKAIAVSSHNGDTEHVAAAQSLLRPDEWGLMQTPLDVPLVQFGRQVRRPRRWYHTLLRRARRRSCAAAGCAAGTARGYTLPQPPVLPGVPRARCRRFLGPEWKPLRIARDGCGLPTVSNTVSELAILLRRSPRTATRTGSGRR